MQIIYAGEDFPRSVTKSIFLAGPSPRNTKTPSWRVSEALGILEKLKFDGVVFIPEFCDGSWPIKTQADYDAQVNWEERALNCADCIAFWIPRQLKVLPGLTTNVEWGRWHTSGKVILGFPPKTPQVSYLIYYAHKFNIPILGTLTETLKEAIKFVGPGAHRIDGECQIPLIIWLNDNFQMWYQAQKAAGNRVDGAEQIFNWHWGNRHLFAWGLHVDMWVAAERKNKSNEIVLSRPNISTVLLYYPAASLLDTKIVLVKDYRPPACNSAGFIYELPGGSSIKNKSCLEVATEEVAEETGFLIDPNRLKFVGTRQLLGTLSCHKAHCFTAELSGNELDWFESRRGMAAGVGDFGPGKWERTYVEVVSLKKILEQDLVDWSNLGMIFTALANKDGEAVVDCSST